jgi:G6PDH family F420-dependent oxidoreductase
MTVIGISLSSEELGPRELQAAAVEAANHGFQEVVLSDHFHPWVEAQGQSPFVWGAIGAIAALTDLRIGTAVTCPTVRLHPAIVAHAAATAQLQTDGRFFLGVGSGENLNEHILGHRWPPTDVRLAMLEEAVEVMRQLWQGDEVTFDGSYYRVENARLYSVPDTPPPVYVSGFGPKAVRLAAKIGDGYINTAPDPSPVETYRSAGGTGPAIAALKCCYAPDADMARRTVHRLWPNLGLPGQLAQELALPALFEQASELVDEETAVGSLPCGPDPEVHASSLRQTIEAGYDEIYVHQIGPDQKAFLAFYRDEVLPLVA